MPSCTDVWEKENLSNESDESKTVESDSSDQAIYDSESLPRYRATFGQRRSESRCE